MPLNFPNPAFNFVVKYGGADLMAQDVSGISAEYDVEEVIDGTNNHVIRKIPKRVKYAPVTIKRGIVPLDENFAKFIKLVLNAPILLKAGQDGILKEFGDGNLVITLSNEKMDSILTFTMHKAFPIKVNIGKFNAQENNIAIEEITFVYSKLTVS